MNIAELSKAITEAHPTISQRAAATTLRTAFQMIHAELSAMDEGHVALAGFGRFVVKQATVGETSATVKRISVRLAKKDETPTPAE